MKYPHSIPSTPVKRRHVPACGVSPATPQISKKIDEGSFYNIYLTAEHTVLRIAKRRESGELEASILRLVESSYVNRMLCWWSEDGFSHFEMEYCPGGNLTRQLGRYKSGAGDDDGVENDGEASSDVADDTDVADRTLGRSGGAASIVLAAKDGGTPSIDTAGNAADATNTADGPHGAGGKPAKRAFFNAGRHRTAEPRTPPATNVRQILSNISILQQSDRSSDSFNDIDRTLEQNTSSIYIDNESESSDLSFTPDNISLPGWAVKMMFQISRALSVIHRAGVIHMDVRPDNILCSNTDYKLCDFNISRIGEGAVDRDGDFAYMAPEVLKNRCYYASDVYSLGMIYLELCNPDQPLPREGDAHRMIRRNDFRRWKVDKIGRMMLEKDPLKRCGAEEVSRHFGGMLGDG